MMKRRLMMMTSRSRGLQALIAASCLVLAGCAAEEAMAEGDESLADESGDMAPDEQGTDEPLEQPGDEVATDQAPEESGPQEQPEEEIDESDDPATAACAGYGQRCGGSTSCCSGLVCGFDGYIRYCRH
jgi:hypothetical protein